MNDIKDEGVTAILGLVLLTHPGREVRIPREKIVEGLPENSGVQVYMDELRDELVIRIASFEEEVESE